jgi:hypothetical protein
LAHAHFGVALPEEWRDKVVKRLTGRRQPERPPVEKPHARICLEPRHLRAHRRLLRGNSSRFPQRSPTVIASSQFTEADFFIRYLAQKAGIGVVVLSEPGERPDPDKINLVYCKDAFAAGDLFLADLKAARADWPAA